MSRDLRIALFVHTLRSDWNNGNAHFLRGLTRALAAIGNEVRAFEPENGWSYRQLLSCEGEAGRNSLRAFEAIYPEIKPIAYSEENLGATLGRELADIDLAIVHEWNSPQLSRAVLDARRVHGFKALFLDTHHRSLSAPEALKDLHVQEYDGALVYGEVLRSVYASQFGMKSAWTFHEAADTTVFKPLRRQAEMDVVWIGNWGDEERTEEIKRFLLTPATQIREKKFAVYGVRYPEQGISALSDAGVDYRGFLPNLSAPEVYGGARLTVHIPRQHYSKELQGIPTIRVFEALACGIPLISAPWVDCEQLFGHQDFIFVNSSHEMIDCIRALSEDEDRATEMAQRGLQTILGRHTCRHRAEQLMHIFDEVSK